MPTNPSAGLAHGDLFTPPTGQTPHEPYRAWSVKVNGAYPENETLDCPTSRYFEVRVLGPQPLLIATVPDGEVTHTVQVGETIVLRQPSRILCPLGYTNVTVREHFSVDAPAPDDEEALAA